MLKFFGISLAALLTVGAIAFCFNDRELSFVENEKDFKINFARAVCLADGVVLGMSGSLICLRLFQWLSRRKLKLLSQLEEIAGIFALYSLVVGSILCLIDFQAVTTF
jgi:hypothetical protein